MATRKTQTTTDKTPATKPARARKTRQPVRGLNKTPEAIAKNAEAEKARKAASRKALRESLAAENKAPDVPRETKPDHKATDAANALATAKADAEALGKTLAEMCEEMGIDENGYPLGKTGYFGPMLALREARKHYAKMANGQPACGDELSTICGAYPREVAVSGLLAALGMDANPYAHLNPGQQSMNLRNKTRTALNKGLIEIGTVSKALNTANKA